MLYKHKINDIKIKPVEFKRIDKKDILGSAILPLYSNVFICARKNSGKTTVIYNIIKQCCDKNSKVIGFVPTHHKDDSYKGIKEYLDKKYIPYEFYTSIKDDGFDLKEFIEEQQNLIDDEEEEDEEEITKPIIIKTEDEVTIKIKKKKKPKKISQKYLIILDDISNELKNPIISTLLKKNRHLKCKILMSSQYYNDLTPASRRQIDNYLLFSNLNEDKIKEIYQNSDMEISFDHLISMYYDTTHGKKYSFLYLNPGLSDYRDGFDKQYSITI